MFTVFGFYKFKQINNLNRNKKLLNNLFLKKNIRGTIIISKEGINGSLSGKNKDLNETIRKIKTIFKLKEFNSFNKSISKFQPYHKPKIKIKKELVPMSLDIKNEIQKINNYIEPNKWNKLTIAMFCTGGIRCEKASVFLKKKGFENVYQLKGGILNYLKKIKKKDSLWKGECFVFDNRVSLKHGLLQGSYSVCSGCRKPISSKDKKSKMYEEGVSCPSCYSKLTKKQKSRFRMRQSQIYKAKLSGKKYNFQKEY